MAAEAAAMMIKHHVRHIPVTDGGRLIGSDQPATCSL
jgi:CBS domain-containing protein